MYKPQDVQDLIDHTSTAVGEHSMAYTSVAGGVPTAGADGHIDDSWLSDKISRKTNDKITAADLPDELVLTTNNKIPDKYFASTIKANAFQTTGTTTSTGYILADGTDLGELLAQAGQPIDDIVHIKVSELRNCSWPNCTALPNNYMTEARIDIVDGVLKLSKSYLNQATSPPYIWQPPQCHSCEGS
jgi:hypothetical protein